MKNSKFNNFLIAPPNTPCKSEDDNLISWIDLVKLKSKESEVVATRCVENVLCKVESFVGGEFHDGSSACSLIPLQPESPIIEENFQEDNRLVNWKKWLEIRKKECKKMSKSLFRRKDELLLNSNPNGYRKMLNRKEVLQKSKLNKLLMVGADTSFWIVPPQSRNGLFSTLPKSVRCPQPEIVYTQTPDLILKEQNIPKVIETSQKSFLNSEYLIAQTKTRQHEIKTVEKCIPEMDNLVLRGNTVGGGDSSIVHLISQNKILSAQGSLQSLELEAPQILMINDQELNVKDQEAIFNPLELIFHASKFEKQQQFINIKNIGVIAINMIWERRSEDSEEFLKQFPISKPSKTFFFNKNVFRIIPDEVIDFPIYFYPNDVGVFSEKWVLKCNPPFDVNTSISMNVFGCCKQNTNISQDLQKLQSMITKKAGTQNVEQIIKDLIHYSVPECVIRSNLLFCNLEKESFLKKNPKYYYHAEVIENLRTLYEEIVGNENEWNFDIQEFYDMILKIENCEKMKMCYEKFITCVKELKVKRFECNSKSKAAKKQSMTLNIFEAFIDTIDEELTKTKDVLDVSRKSSKMSKIVILKKENEKLRENFVREKLINLIDNMVNILEA